MRGMRGVGSGGAKRMKKLPSKGRNVEGATYVITDAGSERCVRCKGCGAVVPVVRWWGHVCPGPTTTEGPVEE
jgi:hypothetical protein